MAKVYAIQEATNKNMLGLGDAKIASLAGALLGLEEGIKVISIAFITAGIFTIISRILRKLKPWQACPFAPFIGF